MRVGIHCINSIVYFSILNERIKKDVIFIRKLAIHVCVDKIEYAYLCISCIFHLCVKIINNIILFVIIHYLPKTSFYFMVNYNQIFVVVELN